MFTVARRMGVGALVLAGFLVSQQWATAQFNFQGGAINPYFVPNAGLTLNQYMAALQAGRAPAQISPYAINPYSPVASPYSPVGDPYGGTNPYSPLNSPYGNPYTYYADPFGSTLRGQADVMRAYGTVITSQEQARIMREQAIQARLDTIKKRFDLEMYIKANTPTFTEEQAKVAKTTLKRIQTNSTPYEVVNGKALNYLLDDVRKFPGKKASMEPIAITEDVLKQLNVTKSSGNLGLLRDEGKFTWPTALQELLTAEQQKTIEAQAQTLVKSAQKNKLDVNVLKDLRNELDRVRDALTNKVLEIPTSQYLDAKRFLNDFDEARVALERGEAVTHLDFLKWAAGAPRTVQDIADYMVSRGLKFAPATANDEAAYRALHSAMVALDVALNAQTTTSAPEEKEN